MVTTLENIYIEVSLDILFRLGLNVAVTQNRSYHDKKSALAQW